MNSQNQLTLNQFSNTQSFIALRKMAVEEAKNSGANLLIKYSFEETPFGKIIMASTVKGICHVAFSDNKSVGIENLTSRFPNAIYSEAKLHTHKQALICFDLNEGQNGIINLHISGTPFQFKVWEALLEIPMGHLSTYGAIAKQINKPKASRAVGTAIGKNPVAFLIPCHRVVQATGQIGGYMWGADRKYKIIAAEAAQIFGLEE